jgi:hypothetical protein
MKLQCLDKAMLLVGKCLSEWGEGEKVMHNQRQRRQVWVKTVEKCCLEDGGVVMNFEKWMFHTWSG